MSEESLSMSSKDMVFRSLEKLIVWVQAEADLNASRDMLKESLERIASWEPLVTSGGDGIFCEPNVV